MDTVKRYHINLIQYDTKPTIILCLFFHERFRSATGDGSVDYVKGAIRHDFQWHVERASSIKKSRQ
jgi:hypothetical protein